MTNETLLVITFIIKILARSNIFKTIRGKHGLNTLRGVRNYERLLKRQTKLRCDLSFLLTCKREKLTPNFAKPKLSIKTNSNATKNIGKIILENEIRNKHKNRVPSENACACMHARPVVGSSPKVHQGCALWWGTSMRNFRIVAKKLNEKVRDN